MKVQCELSNVSVNGFVGYGAVKDQEIEMEWIDLAISGPTRGGRLPKFTARQVQEIVHLNSRHVYSQASIAEMYGVHPSTICRLLNGSVECYESVLQRLVDDSREV